jgi:hypothetical protein
MELELKSMGGKLIRELQVSKEMHYGYVNSQIKRSTAAY